MPSFESRERFLRFGLVGTGATKSFIIGLQTELTISDIAGGRLKHSFRQSLANTLQCVILNLTSVLETSNEQIAYMARRQWYWENRFWLGEEITQRSVELCVKFLAEAEYVECIPGQSSANAAFRKTNSIRPLDKFKNLVTASAATVHEIVRDPAYLPVRLKDHKAANGRSKMLPLPETHEVQEMASHVVQINRVLVRHWPDIELADCQMATDGEEENGKLSLPDLTRRTIYRVFNNGTFEQGGRFYGGWWQSVPKIWRPYITINGKRTVEVDFSEMHPTIVYHWAGVAIPENAYSIPGLRRDLVKQTFNALLNAKGRALKPIGGFDETTAGVPWRELLRIVQDRFKPVEAFFGTGIGLKLQRLDSDIAEAVMLQFAENGIPILPVHDSFLCHHGYEQELRDAMERHFEKLVGVPIKLTERSLTPDQRRTIVDQSENSVTELMSAGANELEAFLSPGFAYHAYEDRVQTWFAKRSEIISSLA